MAHGDIAQALGYREGAGGGYYKLSDDSGPYSFDGTTTFTLMTSPTVQTGDVEIGAVEIKDGAADIRQTVLAASTSPAATDKAAVVAESPNSYDGGAGAVTAKTRRFTLASNDPLVTANHTDLAAILAKLSADPSTATGVAAVAAALAGTLATSQVTQGYSAAVTLTRTADTNAYLANDVLGAATGSTAALTFASMGVSGKEVIITSASLEIDAAALISGETSYILYLYNVTPPSALGDNAAWDLPSGDRASFLGAINLGTPVDLGSTLFIETNGINKQIKLSGTSIFGYLVTVGPYTPTASRVHVITLHTLAV